MFASDDKFFEKASEAIEPEVEELGEYLLKNVEEIQVQLFTGEQMCQLECLIEHLGGQQQCDPEAEKADLSVSQFIMFVMRDVLSYLGLLSNAIPSTAQPSMDYKRLSHKVKLFTDFKESIEECL